MCSRRNAPKRCTYCLGVEEEPESFGVLSVAGGVCMPEGAEGVGDVVLRDDLSVVVVSDRFVDVVPVLGRSHAAIPNASNAGNATTRIRFTGFS